MYKITTRSKKAEKQFYDVLNSRQGIPEKLEKLKQNPRRELYAHKLKGKLEGKWSCSLGGDIIANDTNFYTMYMSFAYYERTTIV